MLLPLLLLVSCFFWSRWMRRTLLTSDLGLARQNYERQDDSLDFALVSKILKGVGAGIGIRKFAFSFSI